MRCKDNALFLISKFSGASHGCLLGEWVRFCRKKNEFAHSLSAQLHKKFVFLTFAAEIVPTEKATAPKSVKCFFAFSAIVSIFVPTYRLHGKCSLFSNTNLENSKGREEADILLRRISSVLLDIGVGCCLFYSQGYSRTRILK